MRARLRLAAAFAVTTLAPAAAQTLPTPSFQQQMDLEMREAQLRQQQQMTEQQLIRQQNQLMTLDAQVRTQQNLADVQAQSYRPQLPSPPQSGRMPKIDTSKLASIPDDKLAQSNERVKAAAGNRR